MSGAIADNGENLAPRLGKMRSDNTLRNEIARGSSTHREVCVRGTRMSIPVQGGVYVGRQ
jgi:hypothetical protein